MGDNTLTVEIKTKADLAGAKAAEAQLEAIISKGKFLGQNLDKEREQLNILQKSLADYAESNKDAGEEVEKLELGHHALHKIMEIIGRETAPEIGAALTAALYGPAGAIIALGVGVEYLSSVLQEARERAQALADLRWDASISSAKELTGTMDDLAAALAKASADQDPVKHKYEEMLAILEAHVAAHKQILEAMEKEALAAVGDDPQKRAAVQAQFAFLQKTTSSAGEQAKFALAQKEIDTRTADKASLEAAAKELARAISEQENGPAYLQAKAENKDKDFAKLQQGAMEGAEDAKRFAGIRAQLAREHGEHSPEVEFAQLGIDDANKKIQAFEKFKANQKLIDQDEAHVNDLKKQQSDAASKAVDNQTAITAGATELQKNKKVFLQNTAGDEVNTAIALAQRAAGGQQLNPSELGFLQTAGTLVAGQSVSSRQAEQMFMIASKNQQVLDSFLTRLFNKLDRLPDFSRYETRLNNLESKLQNTYLK